MPTVPLNAGGLPIDFEPEYPMVNQTSHHDCLFAVIAMISGGCTIEQVRAVAVAQGHIPEFGPWVAVDSDGSLAAFLAAHHGECQASCRL
jgi:hypothetical protein